MPLSSLNTPHVQTGLSTSQLWRSFGFSWGSMKSRRGSWRVLLGLTTGFPRKSIYTTLTSILHWYPGLTLLKLQYEYMNNPKANKPMSIMSTPQNIAMVCSSCFSWCFLHFFRFLHKPFSFFKNVNYSQGSFLFSKLSAFIPHPLLVLTSTNIWMNSKLRSLSGCFSVLIRSFSHPFF